MEVHTESDCHASTCTISYERLCAAKAPPLQESYARDRAMMSRWKWACPVCGRDKWWVKKAKDLFWATHGGGISVCRRCEKNRKDEIDRHNWIYHGKPGAKKDPGCDHEWIEPYPGRFYCPKCHAQLNWMCGCGGSMYVCPKHYHEFIKANAPIEEYLAERAY